MKKEIENSRQPFPWYQPFLFGGALFSMFFGAGNMVYSLWVGHIVDRQNYWYAVGGFILAAVFFPLLGLLGIASQKGCVFSFFDPIPTKRGKLAMVLLLLLVWGPLGAIPRAIAMTHQSLGSYLPLMPEALGHLLWTVVVLFLVTNPKKLIDVFGRWLMPALILSVASLFLVSLFYPFALVAKSTDNSRVLFQGVTMGYQTMDGLAAIFFGKLFLEMFDVQKMSKKVYRRFFAKTFLSALAMLALVYLMLIETSARLTQQVEVSSPVLLMVEMSRHALGPFIGFAVACLMAAAALSTAIALEMILVDFLRINVFVKTKRRLLIALSMSFSYGISLLGFEGIRRLSEPFLQLLYPTLLLIALYKILFDNRINSKQPREEPHLVGNLSNDRELF